MNDGINIPSPVAPFMGADGRLTPVWFQFLQTLKTAIESNAIPKGRAKSAPPAQEVPRARVRRERKADEVGSPRARRERKPDEAATPRARRERRPDEVAPVRHGFPRLVLTKESYKALTLIRLYKGLTTDIPAGWQLADGTNGTPNMKDLFVVGAGNLYTQGATGGSTTISANNLPVHTHSYNDKDTTYTTTTASIQPGTGTAVSVVTGITAGGGDTARTTGNNTTTATAYLPPYYAVAYIINTSTVTVVTDAKLR